MRDEEKTKEQLIAELASLRGASRDHQVADNARPRWPASADARW